MEIIGIIAVLICFAITIVLGGFCLIRSIYFFGKALSHKNKDVTENNYFSSFNFTNAIWIPNGLTEKGQEYRAKAIKDFGIFVFLSAATYILLEVTGLNGVNT